MNCEECHSTITDVKNVYILAHTSLQNKRFCTKDCARDFWCRFQAQRYVNSDVEPRHRRRAVQLHMPPHEWDKPEMINFIEGKDYRSRPHLEETALALADVERHSIGEAKRYKELFEELCEQITQMCEFLGSDRKEVPCDSWHLRDKLIELKRRL